MKMVRLKKKLGGMVGSDEKNSQVSDLVDRYEEEALISFPLSIFQPLPNFTFRSHIATSGTNFVTKSKDKSVKQLTKMIQNLALSI